MNTPMTLSATRNVKQLRDDVLDKLTQALDRQNVEAAARCAQRLFASLPWPQAPADNCVLVAYGGGKDSSYNVAFVRLMQLLILRDGGSTFRLRIATNRHAAMPQSVMENIHRVYKALGMYDDPDVEALLIDGNDVRPFDVDYPIPEHVVRRNRLDLLMTGHRCYGDARPTFCNACNLSMANSFGVAIAHGAGVDVVITGDSMREQRAYIAWVRRLAAKFQIPTPPAGPGFVPFLQTLDGIAVAYFRDIYGAHAPHELPARRIKTDGIGGEPLFFSTYQDTAYRVDDHWDLLTVILGFEFDELAFSFTESDCANPALMAHLRGLKAEHRYGRSYAEGIAEYVEFALGLMRRKEFPPHLIDVMRSRYDSPAATRNMRAKLSRYALEVFGLSEEQLVCMIYSPFTERGTHLQSYLAHEQPELSPQLEEIHALLALPDMPNGSECSAVTAARLEALSGLRLEQLRLLYNANLTAPGAEEGIHPTLISMVLAGDPHKATITTRHSKDGPAVLEIISGR